MKTLFKSLLLCLIIIGYLGCKKKEESSPAQKCFLATQEGMISINSALTSLKYKDGILSEINAPRTPDFGKSNYLRTGMVGVYKFYDTLNNEIYREEFLFNSENRCERVNYYENNKLTSYNIFTLDANGYRIKFENYNSPNDSLMNSNTYSYTNGNMTDLTVFDSKNNEISKVRYSFDLIRLKAEYDIEMILLNHHSNANHLTKMTFIEKGIVTDESVFENIIGSNGLLTSWIQDGFNVVDFTYNCN